MATRNAGHRAQGTAHLGAQQRFTDHDGLRLTAFVTTTPTLSDERQPTAGTGNPAPPDRVGRTLKSQTAARPPTTNPKPIRPPHQPRQRSRLGGAPCLPWLSTLTEAEPPYPYRAD
jgi:hypothetical protein